MRRPIFTVVVSLLGLGSVSVEEQARAQQTPAPPAAMPSAEAPPAATASPPVYGGYPPPYAYPPPPYGYPPPPYGYPPPPYGYPQPTYRIENYVRPPKPGGHQHDGTYVRFLLGAGRFAMSTTSNGDSVNVHGLAMSTGVAVGGAITENLILYAELHLFDAPDPTAEVNGVTTMTRSGTSLFEMGIGPGVAYYLMPINLFASVTVGLTRLEMDVDDFGFGNVTVASSRVGLGFSTTVGKEFWVSPNWGLGLAAQFHYGNMEDKLPAPAPRLHTTVFSLLGSATFN